MGTLIVLSLLEAADEDDDEEDDEWDSARDVLPLSAAAFTANVESPGETRGVATGNNPDPELEDDDEEDEEDEEGALSSDLLINSSENKGRGTLLSSASTQLKLIIAAGTSPRSVNVSIELEANDLLGGLIKSSNLIDCASELSDSYTQLYMSLMVCRG